MSFRGSRQGQFNYHDRSPHDWGFQYDDSSRGHFNYHSQFPQPYTPTIPSPSVAPFRHPQARPPYCEICDVMLGSHKNWEQHRNGRKHQSILREKASNTQKSRERSKCHVEIVPSQDTISEQKNFQQKGIGASSKIPAEGSEGKPEDNTSGNGHDFKRKIAGNTVGYMRMNNGKKRPMESSKPDASALSNSAESLVQKPALALPPGPASPVTAPTCVGGSSLKLQSQHVSASRTQVSEDKVPHEIQNPTAEKNDQPQSTSEELHGPAASDVSTMTEDLSRGFKRKVGVDSVSKFRKMNNGMKRPMESSKSDVSALSNSAEFLVQKPALAAQRGPASPILTSTRLSLLKLQLRHVSTSQTQVSEGKVHHEIWNPTAEKIDQPQSTSEELHDQTASDCRTMAEDMISESAALAIAALPKGPVASQVHAPPPAPGSSFEPENQHVLQTGVLKGKELHEIQNHTVKIPDQPQSISLEMHAPAVSNINTETENVNSGAAAIGSSFQHQIESQNSTDETNIELLPSILVESDTPSGISTNSKTADKSSKAGAKADVLGTELGITQLSQVRVCLQCGDEGFPETLVFCDKCQVYALHRYCLDGPVNFYDDVTWLCEDCDAQEVGKSCHYQRILLPSRTSDTTNSAKDAFQARTELTNYIERVKDNNQQQKNIAAKTKALLSDCHSLSSHAQSQSINYSEEEGKLKEDCQSVSDVEVSSSEGSVTVHDPMPRPIVEPIWRGSWCFSNQSSDTVTGLFAHLSTLACTNVLEETRHLPEVLSANLLQRSEVWPKGFMKSGPHDESIALYFFPSERVERAFDNLVEDMISHDLAIRAVVKTAELLVFPSTVLPIQHRRFQAKYYLWGVFRAKQPVLTSP